MLARQISDEKKNIQMQTVLFNIHANYYSGE